MMNTTDVIIQVLFQIKQYNNKIWGNIVVNCNLNHRVGINVKCQRHILVNEILLNQLYTLIGSVGCVEWVDLSLPISISFSKNYFKSLITFYKGHFTKAQLKTKIKRQK